MIRVPATRLMLLGVVLSVLAGGPTGCAPSRDDSALLTGRIWQATEVRTSQGLTNAPSAGRPTSEFASGKVSGTGGVNRYNGTYTTKPGGKIEIVLGPMTLMAGSPAAMAQEKAFVEGLKSAKKYSVTETSLTLKDDSDNVLASYEVLKETPLVGTEWDCTMYNNGRGGFESVMSTTTITAVFGKDGALSGTAGVNTYRGKYSEDAGAIKIGSGIVSTMMAGDPAAMAQEAAYLAALPQATVYKIEGSTLTLRDAKGAAMAGYRAK